MKKAWLLVLILAFTIVSIAACQTTPDDPVVIQKDLEQMIEKAQATGETPGTQKDTLLEQLAVAERSSDLFTGSDGKLIINVDACVSVTDTNAMSIYRVHSAGFSDQLANRVYQLLCGDTDMYAASESFTKDAIAEEILEQQQKRASGDLDDEARSATEAYIKQLEESYQTAPNTMGTPITSVAFQTKQEYGTSYTVFEVRENEAGEGGKTFSVKNDADYQIEEIQTIDGETVAPRSNAYIRYSDSDLRPGEMMYYAGEVLGEEKIDELETTPIEAQAMAEDILDKIGVDDMEVYSICLMADAPESSGAATRYSYKVKLRRTVDGSCVNSPDYSTYVGDPSYGFEWLYETFYVGICDDGIYYFEWKAPLEVSEIVAMDTTLKPFDEIMDVFRNMMCIVNEPEAQIADRYISIEFDITKITLSLQRISEQNSVTSGLLVPVWNFYGDKIITKQDGTFYTLSERAKEDPEDVVNEKTDYPFLSINAVDGSIIDTSKGY